MAFEPEESGRPRLDWPEHDLVPASRRDTRQPETPEPEPEPAEPEEAPSASVLFTVASRLEGLKTSLNNVASRLDSLARSEEQFREFTTERLGEHAQQISQAMKDISSDLADRAKLQDRSLGEIKSGVDEGSRGARDTTEALSQLRQRSEEMGQSLEVLTGHVQAVAEDLPTLRAELIDFIARADARDEELAAEVTRLIEEVRVLRRRIPVRAASSSGAARRPVRKPDPEPEPEEDEYSEEEPEEAPAPRRRASRARRSG